jgi:hypothetical protein
MLPNDVRTLQAYVAYWLGGSPEDVGVGLYTDHGYHHLHITHPKLGPGPAPCTRVYSYPYSADCIEAALDAIAALGAAA